MNNTFLIGIVFLFFSTLTSAQEMNLPYYEIPEFPETFDANNVAARMIDGLGFRFYWATEGLRKEDLDFRPNEEARTTEETIQHIQSLSKTIYKTIAGKSWETDDNGTFDAVRGETLQMLKASSDILKAHESKLEDLDVMFASSDERTEIPFWNMINGPIADAIWHCGQVVSFRRSSGNPFPSGVSVFSGKKRD